MARYHILLAYAVQTIGSPLGPLNSNKAGKQAAEIIDRLNSPQLQEHFADAANAVLAAAGGVIPTRDRLKTQTFTPELLRHIQTSSDDTGANTTEREFPVAHYDERRAWG